MRHKGARKCKTRSWDEEENILNLKISPILSYSSLFCPILPYSALVWPILAYFGLFCPILPHSALFCRLQVMNEE